MPLAGRAGSQHLGVNGWSEMLRGSVSQLLTRGLLPDKELLSFLITIPFPESRRKSREWIKWAREDKARSIYCCSVFHDIVLQADSSSFPD